jgi:O-antigen/teichoic acid export membrane protein
VLKSAAEQFAFRRPVARFIQWGSRSFTALGGLHGRRAALALMDQLIVAAANFLTIVLVGRIAGPKDLGLFALMMTVYFLLLAVQETLVSIPYTMFAVQLKGVRHRQYSGAALFQSTAWSACVGVMLAIIAISLFSFGGDANLASVIAAFALVSPLWLLREFGRRYLFAHLHVSKVMVMSIVGGSAQLIILGVLAYSGRLSAATALFAIGVGNGIAGFGWLWFSRAEFQFNRRRWLYFARKNWIFGRWLLVCQGMTILGQNTMPWLVWFWLGPTATGLFAACDTIIRFSNPVIVSLLNVFTPRIAVAYNDGGKAELNRIVWKATALLTLVLVAFCIGLAVAGEWLLNRSFGNSYAGYWSTLVVLGINQVVGKFGIPHGGALWLLQRVNVNLLAHGVNFVASLIVAPLLLHYYGSLGAALALLSGSLAYSAVTVGFYLAEISDGEPGSFIAMSPAMSSAASTGGVVE